MRPTEEIAGIKALDRAALEDLMKDLGQPKFRAKQIEQWLYQKGVRSFDEMSNLPAGLREALAGRFSLPFPEVIERQVSEDGTRKYLLRLGDGTSVEAVGLPTGRDHLTVCFSTQAGCGMKCAFCATGIAGLTRSLAAGEMVDQVRVIAEDFGIRATNAVAMGQGEPFSNYDPVLAALRFMNSEDGLGIGARHLTVSTCGLLPGIRRFAAEPEQFTLAVSLHSAVQLTRNRLMPGVRRYPLEQLRDSLISYSKSTGRRPTLEYALIDGENDTDEELAALAAFTKKMLCHVNLIPMNPVKKSGFKRSEPERAQEFARVLGRQGTEVTVRAERGVDIDAACGQLKQVSE